MRQLAKDLRSAYVVRNLISLIIGQMDKSKRNAVTISQPQPKDEHQKLSTPWLRENDLLSQIVLA